MTNKIETINDLINYLSQYDKDTPIFSGSVESLATNRGLVVDDSISFDNKSIKIVVS